MLDMRKERLLFSGYLVLSAGDKAEKSWLFNWQGVCACSNMSALWLLQTMAIVLLHGIELCGAPTSHLSTLTSVEQQLCLLVLNVDHEYPFAHADSQGLLYTALWNPGGVECEGNGCNSKLIWRDSSTYFSTALLTDEIKSKDDELCLLMDKDKKVEGKKCCETFSFVCQCPGQFSKWKQLFIFE